MLIKAKTLKGYKLDCLDGEIGSVREFYFDDHYWTIRYLVAESGNWLSGRQVLISPYALGKIEKEEREISVDLTKKRIENSPSLSSETPVSRQFEDSYYGYYGWPMYWGGPSNWGPNTLIERDSKKWIGYTQGKDAWDPHLRSTDDVDGHYIHGLDGEIGHVEDFIVDDANWAIRYLVINTRNWWPGKKVLVAPQWIDRVSWAESKVFVGLSRDAIKQSPEYTDQSLVDRDFESRLYGHYNRHGYWVDEPALGPVGSR